MSEEKPVKVPEKGKTSDSLSLLKCVAMAVLLGVYISGYILYFSSHVSVTGPFWLFLIVAPAILMLSFNRGGKFFSFGLLILGTLLLCNHHLGEKLELQKSRKWNNTLKQMSYDSTLSFQHVGFYTHGGWVFDYPLAPRSWQRADYQNMFHLLKAMDYDTVMVWPLLEAIPMPLSEADAAELKAFREILQDGRNTGLRSWMVLCPNLTSQPEIAVKPWRERNPYPSIIQVRLDDPTQSASYFAHRESMLAILDNADAYVTIDGDPGGYPGAKPEDFARVFLADQASIQKHGDYPKTQTVIPWIWSGWGTKGVWAEPLEPFVRNELEAIKAIPQPWELLIGRSHRDGHANGRINVQIAKELGLEKQSTLLMYEAIEFEPTPPASKLQFGIIRKMFREEMASFDIARGVMGNAQQPVMALPNIYFFARVARNLSYLKKTDDEVLNDFAGFLGGEPTYLLPAWKCLSLPLEELSQKLPDQLRNMKLTQEAADFIPGGEKKYLDLLAAQVESRRRMLQAMQQPVASLEEAVAAIAEGTDALIAWWSQHHFVMGNNPGAPFAWQYVDGGQLEEWRAWCRSAAGGKPGLGGLAAKQLAVSGKVSEEQATGLMRELLGE